MSTLIVGVNLPAVPTELITTMKATFPAPVLTPGFDRDLALWQAAQHDVVTWIIAHSAQKNTADPIAAQKASVRYGS